MSRVVVDASVSLKWAFDDEDHVAEAVALRDAAVFERRFEMLAPSLWVYEVANGVVVAVHRGRVDRAIGRQALQHLLALGVRLVDPDPLQVYRLAIEYGLLAYDAAYVALAQALDITLWTGDRRLYERVVERTDRVHWVGAFPEEGAI